MSGKKYSILIVDDHEFLRKGLIALLKGVRDMTVAGEAGDGIEAVSRAASLKPDIVLLDILLPNLDGMTAAQKIQKKLPSAKIIFLTALGHKEHIFHAIKIGAAGYLHKELGVAAILSALRQAATAKNFICPTLGKEEILSITERAKGHRSEYDRVTTREREILKHMCDGNTSKEIGSILDISPKTVDNHKANIMAKLGMHTRAQLVKYALRKGISDMKI